METLGKNQHFIHPLRGAWKHDCRGNQGQAPSVPCGESYLEVGEGDDAVKVLEAAAGQPQHLKVGQGAAQVAMETETRFSWGGGGGSATGGGGRVNSSRRSAKTVPPGKVPRWSQFNPLRFITDLMAWGNTHQHGRGSKKTG